jgi:hypothetical protein
MVNEFSFSLKRFWQCAVVIAIVVSLSGLRSFIFLKMPNGTIVLVGLEPSKPKADPINK